jgi:hypothetical protein
MQFILMLHAAEAGWDAMTETQQQQAMGAYKAYTDALEKAGVLKNVKRLQPSSTTATVRVAHGRSQVLNGPYVDTKEQLGGFYIIDVPDLQAAVGWAERCPTAMHGTVEVRPLWADAA